MPHTEVARPTTRYSVHLKWHAGASSSGQTILDVEADSYGDAADRALAHDEATLVRPHVESVHVFKKGAR
jgi:hypothetical protein